MEMKQTSKHHTDTDKTLQDVWARSKMMELVALFM